MNVRVQFFSSLWVVLMVGCGSSGNPISPPQNPDLGPIVNNTPPAIGTFRVQGSRPNQPANFADLAEDVEVTVTVTDAESAIDSLEFRWSSDVGSFTGSGAKVVWRAPAEASTPVDVTLRLEVVERYTSQGRTQENRVTGSTTLALHNSSREVGEAARQFLLDFSNQVPVDQVMENFDLETCRSQSDEERGDVTRNQQNFKILSYVIGPPATSVRFGGICSFRQKAGDACARVPVFWRSRAIRDVHDHVTGELVLRADEETRAQGVDQVAAVYKRAQKRWRLCDSQFESGAASLGASPVSGLVP